MTSTAPQTPDQATFHNSFADELPSDGSFNKGSCQVPGYLYAHTNHTPVAAPRLLAWADDFATELGLARPRAPAESASLAGQPKRAGPLRLGFPCKRASRFLARPRCASVPCVPLCSP